MALTDTAERLCSSLAAGYDCLILLRVDVAQLILRAKDRKLRQQCFKCPSTLEFPVPAWLDCDHVPSLTVLNTSYQLSRHKGVLRVSAV